MMRDGDVNEFVNGLFLGSEQWFLFREHKFFIQGWWENGNAVLVLDDESNDDSSEYVWKKISGDMDENVRAFLSARIWDGKTFWEAEKEMTWVD